MELYNLYSFFLASFTEHNYFEIRSLLLGKYLEG